MSCGTSRTFGIRNSWPFSKQMPQLHDSVQLDEHPLKGRFDVAHLRAIHKFIFQDVFVWAGAFRTVNISKGGNFFGASAFIEPALQDVLRRLPVENYLKQMDEPKFTIRAGFYLGEINAIHPFREGNGRT